jgi:hypothetical protein
VNAPLRARLAVFGAALLLSLAYVLNLGSLYAPTNGDEMVYLHIARLTSESGHWLPLVSDLQTPNGSEMRNTKPPLLFWQAILAGSFSWDLGVLRLPYVFQTLLTALLVGYLSIQVASKRIRVRPQLNGSIKTGLLAATIYLGFFATYRYGRPVLPSSTESLFLFSVCALVMLRKPHPAWFAAGAGLLMIPALLVKSFALAAPVGLWLFAALWISRPPFGLSMSKAAVLRFWQSAWPSTLAVLIGLAGFAMWFVVDPHPAAIWREFIIGENFSTKFSEARSDSAFAILLAPLLNAGLLAPLVLGLCWVAGKDALHALRDKASGQIDTSQKLLWLWIFAWLLVFAIPSQRSARYVIPVMPAVAVLLALNAHRIHRAWWMLTLGLVASATAALGWIAFALQPLVDYSLVYFIAMVCVVALCLVGVFMARYRIAITATCAVAWLALLGALAMPFDGAAGKYDEAVVARFAGQKILVPQNFNAQFERYQFILPASQPFPYAASQRLPASFVAGDVIAARLVLRSRHAPAEVTWAKLSSRAGVQALLVEREVLVLPESGFPPSRE